jgi:hypothetical protein
MKLTRGEFCQFSLNTRLQLLKEFGKTILKKKVEMRLVSVYRISGFYVEVFENLVSQRLEKVEPLRNPSLLEVYSCL